MKRFLSLILIFIIMIFTVACTGDQTPKAMPTDSVVLTIQNETGMIDFTVKNLYADEDVLFSQLEKLLIATQTEPSGELSEKYKHELISMLRSMEGLGLYYDYINKTFIEHDGSIYGAKADSSPIGGGKKTSDQKSFEKNATFTVNDDNTFFAALKAARSGDIIYIADKSTIDLSDLKATEMSQMRIPEGVTIASSGDKNRGTICFSLYQDGILYMLKNSRISGVAIKGIDSGDHEVESNYNKTSALYIQGDNVTIDGCEISGFCEAGIYIEDGYKNTTIHHNFFHHIRGHKDGYGIYIKDGTANISHNLFSNVVYCVGVNYIETNEVIIENNVEAGNITGAFVQVKSSKKDSTVVAGLKAGPKKIVFKNNTVLGDKIPFEFLSVPDYFEVTNNLFSMRETYHSPSAMYGLEDPSLLYAAFTITNNVYNMNDPFIESMSDSSFTPVKVNKIEVEKNSAEKFVFEGKYIPSITSDAFYGNMTDVYANLSQALNSRNTSILASFLIKARTALADTANYYTYIDALCKNIDGVKYGAYVEEGDDPIGGGYGYKEIFTTGDYIVKTSGQLQTALTNAKAGEVIFIPGDVVINLNAAQKSGKVLTVPKGVTIASDRGLIREDGTISTGATICATNTSNLTCFSLKEGSRFTGINLKGPDTNIHYNHWYRAFKGDNPPGHEYFYLLDRGAGIEVTGDNVSVDNCEISGFAWAGIIVMSKENVRIHHNYIHHNQLYGLGYGVTHMGAADTILEYNLLNRHSHSLAADGNYTSYIARYNVDMGGTFGNHIFDVHGGSDRGDGTNIAGSAVEMYNNTMLSDKWPYAKRGTPEKYQKFYQNITLVYPSDNAIDRMVGENFEIYNNVFGIDSNTVTPEAPEKKEI